MGMWRMGWKLKTAVTFLSILAFYITSTAAREDEESRSECADFNNTTWLEYRQQGSKLQVQYLLLTRKNTDCASLFSQESLSNNNSYFNSSLPTNIIVHGYRALGSKPSWVKQLAQALLRAQDANVVVVDWVYGASFAYNLVVENYKEVAVQISVLINQLQNHGCKLESFHFIGVSLGAHVSGFVGTLFKGEIGRITGLDPAGPMFKGADTFDRLDPSDALFVEAIHTDSDYFGISIPVGHADFFLNGGMDQAGCARSRFESRLLENSGMTASPLPQQEKLFLLTTSAPPFCAHHILVQLEVSPLDKTAEVQVTLRTSGLPETEHRLRLETDGTVYRRVIAHLVPLCEIDSIQLKNTGARFYRQGDIHFVSVCISEFPSVREVESLCVKKIDIRRGSPWNHDFVQLCGND
ncbi:phospholipase A1 member A-like isoform X4 [Oncorhynchus nerka]|uniref:phospholipase A1 member A-like isoform X4 n=1 Tax=Oncorhynchus nerka TaxID=8023 RepID=UPI0031B84B83